MDGKKTWFSIDFPSNPVIFAKRTSISDRLGVARGYLQVKLYRGIYLAGSGAPRVHPGAPRGTQGGGICQQFVWHWMGI